MREFVVARNPEEGSTLPYLVRLPLPGGAIVLKVRDVWAAHRQGVLPPRSRVAR